MKNVKGIIAVLIGAVLVVLGLVLPFYSVELLGESMSASLLYADSLSVIGVVWLVFTVLTILFALIGKKVPTVLFGILTTLGVLLSFWANSSELSDLEEMAELVEKGTGYYLSVVGAIAMFVVVIFYAITTKKAKSVE